MEITKNILWISTHLVWFCVKLHTQLLFAFYKTATPKSNAAFANCAVLDEQVVSCLNATGFLCSQMLLDRSLTDAFEFIHFLWTCIFWFNMFLDSSVFLTSCWYRSAFKFQRYGCTSSYCFLTKPCHCRSLHQQQQYDGGSGSHLDSSFLLVRSSIAWLGQLYR